MRSNILTFFFIIYCTGTGQKCEAKSEDNFLAIFENKLEIKFNEYADHLTKTLEKFNDNHLGKSEIGRMLNYEELKMQLEETGRQGRTVKKMSMALMPLIFQVGATSTWMVITAIMTAKSVAIGLALLVFKIAVSSAKVASFFTALKSKHGGHYDHHHEWAWSPHIEHHGIGHDRSFSDVEHHSEVSPHHHEDWHSYKPEWTPNDVPHYKTIPFEGDHEIESYGEYEEKPADRKDKKYS